jgi:hypothetical protein
MWESRLRRRWRRVFEVDDDEDEVVVVVVVVAVLVSTSLVELDRRGDLRDDANNGDELEVS